MPSRALIQDPYFANMAIRRHGRGHRSSVLGIRAVEEQEQVTCTSLAGHEFDNCREIAVFAREILPRIISTFAPKCVSTSNEDAVTLPGLAHPRVSRR